MDQQLDLGFPTAVRETHAAARAVACFDIVPSADAGARILDCGAWLGRRWGLDGGLYPLGRLHLSLWGLGLEPGEAQALDRMRAAADMVRRPPIEIDLVKAMQFGGGARVLGCGYGAKAALSGLHDVLVEMTLTAPGCPVAGDMPGWVEDAVRKVEGVRSARANLVFDPPWDSSKMSDEAKLALNMF